MALEPQADGSANPEGSEGRLSFRERKANDLRNEGPNAVEPAQDGLPDGQPPNEGVDGLVLDDASGQPDKGQPPELDGALDNQYPEDQPGQDDLNEGAELADPDGDGGDSGIDPAVQEWRDKAEASEEARSQMERDYRRKTAMIAEKRRDLESSLESVEAQSEFFAEMANRGMAQFQNINWQALQAEPEKYNEMRMRFQQAAQYQEQMTSTLATVKQRKSDMLEKAREQEADLAREILPTVIPGWNGELYRELCNYAVERFDIPREMIGDVTQHWIFELLNDSLSHRKAADTVRNVRREQTNGAPHGGRNLQQPQVRNAKGKFQTARQKAFDNPGDKGSFREMQERKLRMEREGGRR